MGKQILIITKSLDGGTGTFVKDLIKITKLKNGPVITVEILSLEKPKFRNLKLSNTKTFENGNSYPEKYTLSPYNLIKFYKELVWVKRNIDISHPEVILTIDAYCLFLLFTAKVIWGLEIKTISTVHNNLEAVIKAKIPFLMRPIIKMAIRYFLNKSQKVVCVSKGLAESTKRIFLLEKQPLYIYHGIALPKNKKPHPYSGSKEKIVITIGRLTKQKDYETLLYAFGMVNKSFQKARLQILGDGPETAAVVKLIRNLDLEQTVEINGWKQNPEIFLDKADVFILSSNWEGFGYVILEALSRGIPVISTDTQFGPSEILDNGKYGVLVPQKNPVKMSEAILELLTDRKRYEALAKASVERASHFSLKTMLVKYKNVIDTL